MTAATDIPAKYSRASVRPADRLGFTLFIAALIHLAVILGVSFTLVKPAQIEQTLEITLSTFKDAKAPKKADYLAQDNQEGSGTLDKKALPTTTQVAPFQDNQINKVTPPPVVKPQVQPEDAPLKKAITTVAPKPQKVDTRREVLKQDPQPQKATPDFDSDKESSQISSLEAELTREQQLYAKRPRIHRLTAASTMHDKGAWYKDEWRKKVERIGNLNYPDEARRQQIYGSLRLMVSINSDGSLYDVLVLESSGQQVLDDAAMRIVRLAAPFPPFTGDLSDVDRLEIIRTWRFAKGDRLSSN